MRKDPDRRYQGAAELKAALAELADQRLIATAPAPPVKRPAKRRWRWAAGVALLIAALAVIPATRRRIAESLPFAPLPAQKQIAVLPFYNVGGDASHQAFCDGLVETLTSTLTRLEQFHGSLRVVPASEVRKESVSGAQQAQRAFGVNLVITGSVQRAGNKILVTANLVDAKTVRQLGARTLDTTLEDLATLQDGVIREVADLLELELQPQARKLLVAGGTERPGAYDLYLQGRGILQRYDRQGNIDRAIGLFDQALQQDPRYALAYAGLGDAYLRQYSRTKEAKWLDQAQTAGGKALEINDRLAGARVQLGSIYAARGDNESAVQEFQRALHLDPVSADAHRELAVVYEASGRPGEAETTYRRAIQLRPSDWLGYMTLGIFYTRQARYPDAEMAFQRATELTPDNYIPYRSLGGVYHLMGRFDDAIRVTEKSASLKPSAGAYSNVGTMYFFQGQYRQAVVMNEKAVSLAAANDANDYVLWGNLADSYRWTPELSEKAPDAYRRALQAGQRHLAVNPDNFRVLSLTAVYHAKLGQNDQALERIARARWLAPLDGTVGFKSVIIHELTGQRARALAALKTVLASGYSVDELRREPELAQLRQDPAYQRLLESRSSSPRGKQN